MKTRKYRIKLTKLKHSNIKNNINNKINIKGNNIF